jgi:hypothetical protein
MENISAQEKNDVLQIAAIKAEMENRMNDFDYANNITDELFRYQPFILSTIMGYKMDVPMDDLPYLINLYVLIWLFYKERNNVRKIKITEEQFAKQETRFISLLKKYEATTSAVEKDRLVNEDLENASSKALNTILIMELKENTVLQRLNRESQGAVLAGYNVIIKCFDEIIAQ